MRIRLALLTASLVPACATTDGDLVSARSSAAVVAPGEPLPGLPAELVARFDHGREDFAEVETVADGLGPVFNGFSCAECHSTPAIGGAGAQVETRFARLYEGVFDGMALLGGPLIQSSGVGVVGNCDMAGEGVPLDASIVAGRRTTPLFGLGLVEAVPVADLETIASRQPLAVRGRINWVLDPTTGQTMAGRFGWKAQVATLATFAADAYLNEMGITSPVFPGESCPQGDCARLADCDTVPDPEDDGEGVVAFTDFMTLLAPPPKPALTGQAKAGEVEFERLGCATCHTPVLKTGPNAIAALDRVNIHPFSDFLVHDMGALGDGMEQGVATGREMRTAPLWGVSKQPSFLHDGSATTLEAAILAHDGQGRAARDAYAASTTQAKAKLLAFLNAL